MQPAPPEAATIGADFRFEVPGQSSVGLRRRKGSVVWGAPWRVRSINEPIRGGLEQSLQGVQGQSCAPPEAESILVIGCPTEPANLAPFACAPPGSAAYGNKAKFQAGIPGNERWTAQTLLL